MTSKSEISKEYKLEEIEKALQNILEFKSDDEKLQFEVEALHLDTMGVIEKLMKSHKNKIYTKKDLAEELNTSQSYITQLFTGSKLINFKTLAKFQRIFNIRFKVDFESNYDVDFYSVGPFKTPKVIPIDLYIKKNTEKYFADSQPTKKAI